MKLTKYRVSEFRSVSDSGWIDTFNVTTLIGTNESGKTNMMIPLWKLNPAEGGEIDFILDIPRKKYLTMRALPKKPIFIRAIFELSEDERKSVAEKAGIEIEKVVDVQVGKDYDGNNYVDFVNTSLDFINALRQKISEAQSDSAKLFADSPDSLQLLDTTFEEMIETINEFNGSSLELCEQLLTVLSKTESLDTKNVPAMSTLQELLTTKGVNSALVDKDDIKKFVLDNIPKFVYYSSYGNIDSEIYLPQVIANFERTNLGVKEAAKVRTLKMLFDFVKLDPKEIQSLGAEKIGKNDDKKIKRITAEKKEREILLQSASSDFTTKFNNWWKQGNYSFDFKADGDFFRIWVSDNIRSDKIELESRSTGLQWFFSFYLTFLIECASKDHQQTILLLDEPGLTLHPLAQEDLFAFFDKLSEDNQIVFSTHSPFMVNSNHFGRVASIYVDDQGYSCVSRDLRSSHNENQIKSVYPVQTALNLVVSNSLLYNCTPVIVEKASDQIYFNVLKNYLISQGEFRSNRELVFIPAGGLPGIKAVLPLLISKNNYMPWVVLDSNSSGITISNELVQTLYKDKPEQVINLTGFGIENPTIEDLIPAHIMRKIVIRNVPRSPFSEEEFEDVYNPELPILEQIYDFCAKHKLKLPHNFVEDISKKVKTEIIKQSDFIYKNEKRKFDNLKQLLATISTM